MPALDVESLLSDLSADSPCGEDLAYDPAYLELQRTAQGTPEQQIGDTIIPAEEPNWREVRERAHELWGRSKDLRLALLLALGELQTNGLIGLAGGLGLIRGVLERHWEGLYPRLDPDDANDPTERINIISALSAPAETFGDPMMFQRRTQEAPLTDSRQLGRFSMRDILIAKGELSLPPATDGQSRPTSAVIDGAFDDTPIETLQALAAAAADSLASLSAISKALDGRVGLGNAPSLRGFESLLAGIGKELAARLARRGVGGDAAGDGAEGAATGETDAAQGGGGGGAAGGPSLSGQIRSSKDVVLALDKISRYYEQAEVSSPVPLFMKAAHKLVSKNFLEINRILSADVIRSVEEIANHGETPPE
jgi:type VI secretion system protein ImpA